MKYGLGALNNTFNPNRNNGFENSILSKFQNIITSVRVKNIILDESNPSFLKYGEWNGLGVIEYIDSSKPYNSPVEGCAYPLNPNNKNYPLINEVVYLISLPSTDVATFSSAPKQYYINIVGLWNHPHHNGFPANPYQLTDEQNNDYVASSLGSVRRIQSQSTEIFLGNTFKERSDVHPLLPFEGDNIYEGRWGNSIRFGSTVQNRPNNWSVTGSNGDPILIIRNGQGDTSPDGWVPTVENINKDLSSIYLTSTQQIPLKVAQTEYKSYLDSAPTSPDKYSGKQIILNSGRLVFNSNQDHILLSSNKSVNINTIQGLYIDSPKGEMVVNSPNIQLGSADSFESALKGDTTVDILSDIMNQLILLIGALQSVTPTGGPGVSQVATSLLPNMQKLLAQLQTQTKSNVVKLS